MKLSSALADRTKAKTTPGVVLPLIKEQMLREFTAGSDRRQDIIHPSELSHQADFCPRAVYIRITEGALPPANFDWGLQNIFDEGHAIHAKWQDRLRRSTALWGNWHCLVCGDIVRDSVEPPSFGVTMMGLVPGDGCLFDGGHIWEYQEIGLNAVSEAMLYGHADGGFGETLVELKSVGEGTVRIENPRLYMAAEGNLKALWDSIKLPFPTHRNQGDIYLWIAVQRGMPFRQISYVYESKWNQQVKEFVVEYDEARSLKLVDQAKAIKYAVEHHEEPACRFPGSCKNCAPYDERRAKTS